MVSIPAALLLTVLYVLIFDFSAQDAEQSGNVSRKISKKCVELANELSGREWSPDDVQRRADAFEHPLRKIAHFSEYASMGALLYVLWRQWFQAGRWLYALIGGWLFLSAVLDEVHQYFVPGRYCSVADVLLDTCGGLTGMLVCVAIAGLYVRRCGKQRR